MYISHTWCLIAATVVLCLMHRSGSHLEARTVMWQHIGTRGLHTLIIDVHTQYIIPIPIKPPPSPLTRDPACCSIATKKVIQAGRAHRGRGQYQSWSCVSLRFIPTGLNTMFVILFGCHLQQQYSMHAQLYWCCPDLGLLFSFWQSMWDLPYSTMR